MNEGGVMYSSWLPKSYDYVNSWDFVQRNYGPMDQLWDFRNPLEIDVNSLIPRLKAHEDSGLSVDDRIDFPFRAITRAVAIKKRLNIVPRVGNRFVIYEDSYLDIPEKLKQFMDLVTYPKVSFLPPGVPLFLYVIPSQPSFGGGIDNIVDNMLLPLWEDLSQLGMGELYYEEYVDEGQRGFKVLIGTRKFPEKIRDSITLNIRRRIGTEIAGEWQKAFKEIEEETIEEEREKFKRGPFRFLLE